MNNFVLVITPEVCNLLSYMRNLHIQCRFKGTELADRQTVRFFIKKPERTHEKASIKKMEAGVKNGGGR